MRHGSGWIIDGNFKLIHAIDLSYYTTTLNELFKTADENIHDPDSRAIALYNINLIEKLLKELQGHGPRHPRAINWLGSAWKWLAGSPDADDWDKLLSSHNQILTNNNLQYKINSNLFKATEEALSKVSLALTTSNKIDEEIEAERFIQNILHKLAILRDQVGEICRACELAKNQIVNVNLLDWSEISQLLAEVESLPWENPIQAIEYSKPSVFSNGTLLLYIVSLPKVRSENYHVVLARASILNGKQVELPHDKLMINQAETYGIMGTCTIINNASVCHQGELLKIPEDSCIPRIIKGGKADCHFKMRNEEIIELVDEGTIFATNFLGEIQTGNSTQLLNGTYVIQFRDENVRIGNYNFSNQAFTKLQALPAVLSNVTNKGTKISLEYVHGLSMENIKKLNILKKEIHASLGADTLMLLGILSLLYIVWSKIFRDVKLPKIKTKSDLRDADFKGGEESRT